MTEPKPLSGQKRSRSDSALLTENKNKRARIMDQKASDTMSEGVDMNDESTWPEGSANSLDWGLMDQIASDVQHFWALERSVTPGNLGWPKRAITFALERNECVITSVQDDRTREERLECAERVANAFVSATKDMPGDISNRIFEWINTCPDCWKPNNECGCTKEELKSPKLCLTCKDANCKPIEGETTLECTCEECKLECCDGHAVLVNPSVASDTLVLCLACFRKLPADQQPCGSSKHEKAEDVCNADPSERFICDCCKDITCCATHSNEWSECLFCKHSVDEEENENV